MMCLIIACTERKRRATSPSTFGAALEGLLGAGPDSANQQKGQPAILSLAPHVRRSAQSSRLNEKASRLAVEAKKKRLERARVKDVISGWGAPGQVLKTAEGDDKEAVEESEQMKEWQLQGGSQAYEKKLKKVAQRGVVKLFNAIRAAQNTTTDDVEMVKGTSKEERGFKTAASNTLKGENVLGGKAKAGESAKVLSEMSPTLIDNWRTVTELSKNNFFDLIRSGTKATAAH